MFNRYPLIHVHTIDGFIAIKQYNPPTLWMKIVRKIVHIPPMANNDISDLAYLVGEILQMSASLKSQR